VYGQIGDKVEGLKNDGKMKTSVVVMMYEESQEVHKNT
jgi:hypothetical protein